MTEPVHVTARGGLRNPTAEWSDRHVAYQLTTVVDGARKTFGYAFTVYVAGVQVDATAFDAKIENAVAVFSGVDGHVKDGVVRYPRYDSVNLFPFDASDD